MASTTLTTGAQRPLVSANRDADRKAFETSKAAWAASHHDVYSRACTHSSFGRDLSCDVGLAPPKLPRAAPGVMFAQPLMVLSCAMESMWLRMTSVAELPFFAYFALRG